jgi:nucleotide-binding universal stress UspA family protein
MKKIIVPVDFSTTSINAAQFGAELAVFYGAEILLYHAYQLPVVLHEFSYPVFDINETQEAALHELDIIKENIQAKLKMQLSINIIAEMVALQDGLAALCDTLKPDLIIMGLSGKNALTRLMVGSNTIKTIQELKYPILVVPPKAEFVPVRKMGFACDYKKIETTTPVGFFKKVVTDFRADLYVLNINRPGLNQSEDTVKEAMILQELLKEIKPLYNTIEAGDVIDGINWFIEKEKLDWIVVIPKKHPLLQKMFSRSHTKDLLHHTSVPVLCIHE